jgi:hypothetical protein
MFDFIRQNRVDGFCFLGDQFDNGCISHFNRKKPLNRPPGQFLQDQQGFERDILTPLEKSLPKSAAKVWIVGNHDDWESQFAEANPELAGLVDRTRSLRLRERGWKIVPIGRSYSLGKLTLCHGEWASGRFGGGILPAKKAAEAIGGPVLMGHTHSLQCYTTTSPVEKTFKNTSWVAPILGATNATFMKNRPSNYTNGFVVVEVREGGLFNCYPVLVHRGQFAYGGRLYGHPQGGR